MAPDGITAERPRAPPARASSVVASNAPRWRVYGLAGTLGPHLAAWSELNARRFADHPMLSGLFVDGLLRHFANGTEHLCVLEAGEVTRAMCVLQRRSLWQWTAFRPPQAQIGCLLIPEGEALSGLLECLPGRAVTLDLACVDPLISGHLDAPLPSFRSHHARTMAVTIQTTYAEYLASRSGQLRKNLRRYARKVEADGLSIRYESIDDPAHVAAAVLRYAQLESRGWKGAGGTALEPGGTQARFYSDLLVAAAQFGQASVHEMWLGNTLAASRLVVRSERMTIILKTTYDESFASYAPGRLLLAEVLRLMHDRGRGHVVEFYTDASAEQLSWATDSRCIYDLRVYRGGLAGALAHGAYRARQLARRVTRSEDPEGVQVDCLTGLAEAPPDVVEYFDDRLPAHGLQSGIDWFRLLQRHCFADGDCAVFVLRHRGVPVAALPLRRDGARAEAMANFYTASFAPPIAPWLHSHDLRPLLRAVRAHWPRIGSVELWPMDRTSQVYMLLHEAMEHEGFVTLHRIRHANWILPRGTGIGWAQYLATRPGVLRSTLARASRRFESRGGWIEVISGGDRLETGLAAYEAVYAASWKRSERYPAFIRDSMRMAAQRGALRLGIAWLGESPIAAQLWTVIGGRAEIFKLAYDERHKALSPGSLLTAHLMRLAIEQDNVRIVDFLSGDDRYKMDWMTHRDLRWSLAAHDPRRLGGCWALVRALGGALLASLRSCKPRAQTC